MHQTKTLSRVLNIREKEKKDAQLAHHESAVYYERANTQLYTLLIKKEDAQETYVNNIQDLTTIEEIREQNAFIESLHQQINTLQVEVNKAREKMESKQLQLTDAHVEVKKFEKIIEIRKQEQMMIVQRNEQILMDEISTQQYISRK